MTQPQHMQALAVANRRKRDGAAFKRQVAALRYPDSWHVLIDHLREQEVDETPGCIKIEDYLAAGRQIGDRKASWILTEAHVIRRGRRLRELTPRERHRIANAMERRINEFKRPGRP